MQSPTLVVSRDRYDIESLTQKKPGSFKPQLLNTAVAGGANPFARTSLAPVGSGAGDWAPAVAHTSGIRFALCNNRITRGCDVRKKDARQIGATAFRVGDHFTQLPRVGPPPFCPTAIQPWAGLYNPLRMDTDGHG